MPRKTQEQPQQPVPPGPLSLVIRAGTAGYEKIVCGQRVYSYEIDQSDPALVVVYGHLRPVVELIPLKSEPVKPTAELRLEAAGDVTKEEN